MKKILLVICCVFLSWNASALEVAGVKLEDNVHPGSRDLVLNGAGLRTKLFFKVYVAALYLSEKKTSGAAVQSTCSALSIAPSRPIIRLPSWQRWMLRSRNSRRFFKAWMK